MAGGRADPLEEEELVMEAPFMKKYKRDVARLREVIEGKDAIIAYQQQEIGKLRRVLEAANIICGDDPYVQVSGRKPSTSSVDECERCGQIEPEEPGLCKVCRSLSEQ